MKLDKTQKTAIQCIVYFLFNGSFCYSSKNIGPAYLHVLFTNPEYLYNCFELFTYSMQQEDSSLPERVVTGYIEQLMAGENPDLADCVNFNRNQHNFWNDFLELAHKFSFDELSNAGIRVNLYKLDGCGTDAVPIFAVWTNIIELNENNQIINKSYVMNRIAQRFNPEKQNMYFPKFEEWEVEQEIY